MIEERVTIARPVSDVFAFYRNLSNLPRFLGDVLAVEPLGADRWRWTIAGPLGIRLHWTVRVTEVEPDRLVAYQLDHERFTTEWRVTFATVDAGASTLVTETLAEPGGRLTDALLALIGKHSAAEVRANLARLKQLMETGRVTNRDQAVAGKFEA